MSKHYSQFFMSLCFIIQIWMNNSVLLKNRLSGLQYFYTLQHEGLPYMLERAGLDVQQGNEP